MRAWFSVADILSVRSPALPTDIGAMSRYVDRCGWREDERRARLAPGAGREGGTWEYHHTLLPAEVAAKLLARETGAREIAAPVEQAPNALWQAFERLSTKQQDEARARLAAVDRVAALAGSMPRGAAVALVAAEAGASASTLWTWLRMAGEVGHADRLPALAPRYSGRTATAACDPDAWSMLVADYLRPEEPCFEACYRRLEEAAAVQGWTIPSAKTLKRRIERDIPRGARVMARKGASAAQAVYPHQRRDRSVFSAMQAVNADGHKFDVFCRWPDGSISRPMMVAVQDLYSGMIVGHRIDRTESWTLARAAFADAIESFGVPEDFYLDNGRAFASKWISGGTATRFRFKVREDEPEGLLPLLGCRVHWATLYHGQAKPIERAFRDLCEEIARHPACAGAYTGNSPDAKPDNYASKAIPIDDFRAHVAQQIARHNTREGRRSPTAAGRSFAQTLQASLDAGALVRRASPTQLRLMLLAAEGVRCDKRTGAVEIFGNRYWHERLVDLAGRRIVARFDPTDLLRDLPIYALDGKYLCDAPCIEATGFNDATAAREHAHRRRAWLKAQREILSIERRMTIDQVARLLPAPDPVDPPRTPVVRLVANGFARPAAAPRADEDVWAGADAFGRAVERLELESGSILPFRREEEGGPG